MCLQITLSLNVSAAKPQYGIFFRAFSNYLRSKWKTISYEKISNFVNN